MKSLLWFFFLFQITLFVTAVPRHFRGKIVNKSKKQDVYPYWNERVEDIEPTAAEEKQIRTEAAKAGILDSDFYSCRLILAYAKAQLWHVKHHQKMSFCGLVLTNLFGTMVVPSVEKIDDMHSSITAVTGT